jgi:hypothetical protein
VGIRREGERDSLEALICPKCRSDRVVVLEERPHPIFGRLGMTIVTMKCHACGETIEV